MLDIWQRIGKALDFKRYNNIGDEKGQRFLFHSYIVNSFSICFLLPKVAETDSKLLGITFLGCKEEKMLQTLLEQALI